MYIKKKYTKKENNKKKNKKNQNNNIFYDKNNKPFYIKTIKNVHKINYKNEYETNKTINNIDLNISNNEIIEDKDSYLDESSYDMKFMHTARNKWRSNKKEETEEKGDNMHEIIEIRDDLKIYKYSNAEKINCHKLIYEYHYDKFDKKDYKNAYIILFIGKTGDGKTTAINAFFNIIKGIKLEDKYRYILIKEAKKPKGQAESQTDGLHLYYLKDNNNKPIIIIDSQGYGDTRGKEYDEFINEAFEYAFTKIIDHINTVCFIAKSSEARLDILTRYIFSCATSLFSDDICNNFIILNTFANKDTMRGGPHLVESIQNDNIFKEIIKTFDKKWWYACESINIFDNENNKLTLYSFQQLNELYEEKVKKSRPRNILKSSEIISERNKIKDIVKDFILKYKSLNPEKLKIPGIENKIKEYENKISDIDWKINNKRNEISYIYVPNLDDELSYIEKERDRKINILDNQYEEKTVRRLKYVGGNHTYCRNCERNCHEYCDCIGGFVNRCYIFPVFGTDCEICGHSKYSHTLHSSSKYVDETERKKINNYSKIQSARNYYRKRRNEIYNDYYKKRDEKSKKENELNNYKNEKNKLYDQKNYYINDKQRIKDNIEKINKDILLIILKLRQIIEKIKNLAMNVNHIDIEIEYIESSIERLELIGGKNEEIKKMKEYLKYFGIFKLFKDISDEKLIDFRIEDYTDKLKEYIV